MAALIATFIGPAFLWRMADQALEYRKGKAEAGSASPSPIGEQPHSVPEAEVSTEHKKQNFLRAFTWEFLAAQVLIDVSFLLSMVFELSSELTAYFFLGASVLPLLFSKRASTVWLWLANIWRCIDEFWLRLLAVMSSIAPVFIVLLLLQLETNALFIIVGLMLQVFYALLYIPILAKPKDNRRQDLTLLGGRNYFTDDTSADFSRPKADGLGSLANRIGKFNRGGAVRRFRRAGDFR